MTIVKEFQHESKCSYLDDLEQELHYKVIHNCTTTMCSDLIERGYRRFGQMFFRPICATCSECQSIKIDVNNYLFSKSSRRVLKKASNIKICIQKPSLTQEHLNLFEKYHLFMKNKKGWSHSETTAKHYFSSFVDGAGKFGREVLYFEDDKLIGVDLVDMLSNGISSIYFYYDPDYRHLSLGKLSLLQQITMAQNNKLDWIYLGYYVEKCPSLSYKSEYKPYTTLQERPDLNEEAIWK